MLSDNVAASGDSGCASLILGIGNKYGKLKFFLLLRVWNKIVNWSCLWPCLWFIESSGPVVNHLCDPLLPVVTFMNESVILALIVLGTKWRSGPVNDGWNAQSLSAFLKFLIFIFLWPCFVHKIENNNVMFMRLFSRELEIRNTNVSPKLKAIEPLGYEK